MSGTNVGYSGETRQIRKGAADTIRTHVTLLAGKFPDAVSTAADDTARQGGTSSVVSDSDRILGVAELKDVTRAGIRERFAELRQMGIKMVMITGDNCSTAAPIAVEAGVDDLIVKAMPETKPTLIREQQTQGQPVTMTGDGTNGVPVLAQADVVVAMNSGTQVIKEAGSMVNLDSSPTELIQIVEIGKQMLMTRGSLTAFPIVNDAAKYFAIIPAASATTYPQLAVLNVMHLAMPASVATSVVIFSVLIIVFLIPLTLRGVEHRALRATTSLRRNLLICSLGGLLLSFPGIKITDTFLAAMGWA